MSKIGDAALDDLRPLNARSIALSALLGTHPPVLPGRALVALAELFEIQSGTMRTALSRMTAAGEVVAEDGRYRLSGRLLDRQRSQDLGRREPTQRWDGGWHTVIAADDQRPLDERRRLRTLMADHRFGELRPDIWMRPSNLTAPPPSPGLLVLTGPLAGDEPSLARRLWDLEAIAARAARLLALLDARQPDGDTSIPRRFDTAAAVVRFLRFEPLLPPGLGLRDWQVDELRDRYVVAELELQELLRRFFRRATAPTAGR